MSSQASGSAANMKAPVGSSGTSKPAPSLVDQALSRQDFQLADALSLVKKARAAGLNLPDNATYIFMPPKTVNGPGPGPSPSLSPSPSTSSALPSPKFPAPLKRSHSQSSIKNGTIEKNKDLFSGPQSAQKRRRALLGGALKKTLTNGSPAPPLSRRSTRSATSSSKEVLMTEDDDTSEMEASTSSGISSEVPDKSRVKKDESGQSRRAFDDEYEVERIVRKRVTTHGGGKRTRYQVKWLGHDEMTWEPRSHFATDNDAWIRFKREEAQRSAQKRRERRKKRKLAGREGGGGGSGNGGRKSAQSTTPEGDEVEEADGPPKKEDSQKSQPKEGEKKEEKGEEGGKKGDEKEEASMDTDQSTMSTIELPDKPLDPKAAMREVEELDEDVMALSSTSPLKKSALQSTIAAEEPDKSLEVVAATKEAATSGQTAIPSTSSVNFPSSFTVLAVGPASSQPKHHSLTLTQVKPSTAVVSVARAALQQKGDSSSTPVTSSRVPISTITASTTPSQPTTSTGFPSRNGLAVQLSKSPEVTMTNASGNVFTIKAIKARPPITVVSQAPINGPRPIMTVTTPLPPQKKTPTGTFSGLPPSPEIAAPSGPATYSSTVRGATSSSSTTSRILSNLMTAKRTLQRSLAAGSSPPFRGPLTTAPSPSSSGTQTGRTVTFSKQVVHIPTSVHLRPPPAVQPVRRPVNPFATMPVKTIAHSSDNTTLTSLGAKSLIADMGASGKSGLESGSLVVAISGFKPREAGITCLNDVSFLISYADRDPEFVDYEVCIQKIPHEVAEFLFKNRIYALDCQPLRQT